MKTIFAVVLSGLTVAAAVSGGEDPLDRILDQMDQAECCRFDFLSILESDIFESVDTTHGAAEIARDDRFRVNLGSDVYLQTHENLYSYSADNNQVTVEPRDPDSSIEEVSFITRLREFYRIEPGDGPGSYILDRLDSLDERLPGHMILRLDEATSDLASLEYRDINDERNWIVFQSRQCRDSCPNGIFEPDFPDSVEYIRLF